jgi:quinoprotein glucose dehydrogenase
VSRLRAPAIPSPHPPRGSAPRTLAGEAGFLLSSGSHRRSRARVAALLVLAVPRLQQDTPAPYVPRVAEASDEARQALGAFQVPAGLKVELFAAEPHLANPVAFCIDHDGTVFVAETFRHHQGVTDIREHMDWLDEDLAARSVEDRRAMIRAHEGENYDPGYGHAFDRVRRIVDTDGDGVADADTLFAEGFDDHAAGIGAGVLSYRGSVYYTCIPDLWLLRDGNRDGVAEARRALSTGYGVHVALLGHDLHGLIIGPDRRLYFSCGDRAFRVETPDGVIDHTRSGAVLRCELDGSNLEVWHSGLRNPQELAFDDLGNLWTGDNNSDGGDRARWVNVVEGGDSGWRYAYQWITEPVARGPWNDEKLWHPHWDGQAAYLVPPVANLADGPSGLTCYPGTGLGAKYDGHFFLCDFRGDASYSGIHTFTVEPRGASWALGPVERFVWGTLVTDCDFGPDGALWFSDWVYGWEQTGKGRLYRVVDPASGDSELVASTRSLLATGVHTRPDEELEALLDHPDRRVRQEAHFELAARGQGVRLAAVAAQGPSRRARLHALWGLGIAARKDPRWLAPLLDAAADRDDEVRALAIRLLGDERHAPAIPAVVKGLSDASARVRFFAAIAAGRLSAPGAIPALTEILRATGESDPNLRHAAVMGLLGCLAPEAWDALATDASRDVRIGAVLVARRRGDARVARLLPDVDPAVALEAARAIGDQPIEAALGALAGADQHQVTGEAARAWVRRILAAAHRVGDAGRLAALAADPELDAAFRVEALELLADWREPSARDHVMNEWRPIAPRGVDALPPLVARLSHTTLADAGDDWAEAWTRVAVEAHALDAAPALDGLVRSTRPAAVKVAALEALEALEAPGLVASVRAALGDRDGRVRAGALERLERIAPSEVLPPLPQLLAEGEIAERRSAYRLLARHGEPVAVELLATELQRLRDELIPGELALDLVLAAEEHEETTIRDLLAAHLDDRRADPQLAPYMDGLFGGDARRGERVFQRVELSCTRCHAWWKDAAERVGPNLFGVSQRRTRLQILEAIVTPNRTITPGYGAEVFFLRDGRAISGRVVEESGGLVRLFDANNDPVAVELADVDERREDLSAMPEDLAKTITRREMRDLLAYLGQL